MSGVGCVGIVGIGRGVRRFEGGVHLVRESGAVVQRLYVWFNYYLKFLLIFLPHVKMNCACIHLSSGTRT